MKPLVGTEGKSRNDLNTGNNQRGIENIKKRLKSSLSLNKSEIEVYLYLLNHEEGTATEVGRETKVHRSQTYEIFRKLEQLGLIRVFGSNPQTYRVVSPRTALDYLILKQQEKQEQQVEELRNMIPALQKIWYDEHEELLGSRISLLSQDMVREVLPQETINAKKSIYLCLKDPDPDIPISTSPFASIFDFGTFFANLKDLAQRQVKLKILIGEPDKFLDKIPKELFRVLVGGIVSGFFETRALNRSITQSLIIVDSDRSYLFFLSPFRDSYNEALRAESRSLTNFLIMIFEMLWESAQTVPIQKLVSTSDLKNFQ